MNAGTLAARLTAIVGASHVLDDPDMKSSYEVDWTGRFTGRASFVVRPGSTEEVASLVRLAREARVPLVPQGGNSGLVGGAVPGEGSIVVSMQRMTELGDIDEHAATVTAGAGVTLDEVTRAAGDAGLFWPLSHAGGGRATVGGTIATNAGGVLSWRFGTARHHVRGLEAVLGDGRVVERLGALVKDNAGYDLTGLLCGSEGTLGIVTRATLALQPRPSVVASALVALDDPAGLSMLARSCRRLPEMWAAEVVFGAAFGNACARLGLHDPFDRGFPAYAVLRCVGERALDVLAELAADRPSVQDERVWDIRERQNEAAAAAGVPVKLDVSVPIEAIAPFAATVESFALDHDTAALIFGHLLDGNLHVNLVGEEAEGLEERVVRTVVDHGGSIAAEHGIGRAKTRWLSLVRSRDEIETMAAIKRAVDPDGIMNPGVVLG